MVLPPPDLEIKLKIKQEIRNIEVPKNKQFVVYKRSYPFNNKNFFPQLTDLVDFSPRVKVIIMTRYFQENVLSILRRGFEKDTNIAISRIAQGYDILTQQILSNPDLDVMEIKYDNIIDENQKTKILLQICSFLEIKPGNLEKLRTIIKLPTTHIQLDNSDKNKNSYSYIPSNHFYRRKLRASEVKDNILVQVNPVKRKVEKNNRLIFCINSGRCGSNYLAELLGTAEEVITNHPAKPTITRKYLKAINEKSYDQSFSERWIKVEELKKFLSNLSPGQVYVETNHMFIKTFFDVVLEEFKDNVEVIILRRNLVSVLKSFIELGYFSEKNGDWQNWMSSPNSKTAAIKCIDKDEELDQYDLCISYLIDMEARALRFQKDYPWVKTYEVYLENLKDYDLVEKLFADLGITPTAKTREIYAIPVNQKKDRKKKFNVGQVSLEYCNQRIAMYIEKAKSMGIEIPETLAGKATLTSSSPLPELPINASWEDYYQLAEELSKQKELNSAITAYQKVIEINPKHSWSYQKLANIFREQNQDDQAVTAYRQAIEINPNFSWSHYHLATILEKQGKLEEAKASYQKAMELYPNFSTFRYKLDNLLKH